MAILREDFNGWVAPIIKQLYEKDSIINICFNESKFQKRDDGGLNAPNVYSIDKLVLTIIKPNGEKSIYTSPLKDNKEIFDAYGYAAYNDSFIEVNVDSIGEYHLKFDIIFSGFSSAAAAEIPPVMGEAITTFVVENNGNMLSNFSIQSVIQRILDVTPTRTANGVNKYIFRNNAEEYATEESPEFTFTGKHLFEVMLDIASYKKMFPALYKNELYFRPFWNGKVLTSEDLPPPIKAVLNSAIDQYCTALDSYVENMVCINDTNVGTVVEPYKDGYVSARSNSGSAISETSAVVSTHSAIYQPIALNVGEINGVDVGDIQTYTYEQEDYDALSDTSAAYPYSKGYALKYTRFSKNYTELSHRIKTSSVIADALTKPALANIIGAKTNGAVGDTGQSLKDYLSAFIGKDDNPDGLTHFPELLFQPSYIPVVNARVRQYKPMISVESNDTTLFYNQQAEVVDSEAFGEHIKGLVQKLGNHTEIRVYRFDRVDDVPTVGTLIDEKSVYNVAMTIYENHVDATICLVDYAELSTYIGVKNEIKTSDISSTKWSNRFINWEEFLVFTHEDNTGNALSVTKDALEDIVSFTTVKPLTCAMFTTYAESGDSIITAFAPIKHLAIGNSIYFQWEMLDNFAVGYKSEDAPEDAKDAWSGTKYDRAQRAVRYCDSFGRMEKIDFQLLKIGPTPGNADWLITEEDLSWTVDEEDKIIKFTLDKTYSCYIIVFFQGPYSETRSLIFEPNQTSATMGWGWTASQTRFSGASVYNGYYSTNESEKAKMKNLAEQYIRRQIAHEYPQKPRSLSFVPGTWQSDEEKRPAFELYDWLIKKNSAEALKFATQYHFRQTWREFIIGSGMSNFCSLIGGACGQLQFFVSNKYINRFDRHVKWDSGTMALLEELPTFTVEEDKKRIAITLPGGINSSTDIKSWSLVGIDKNGNAQLIFGENKNARNEAFLTTIYLVAIQKNNEPPQRSTWRLQYYNLPSSVGAEVLINNAPSYGFDENGGLDVQKGSTVTLVNNRNTDVNLTLRKGKNLPDGSWEESESNVYIIKGYGSYSFTITSDVLYSVWTTGSSGGDWDEVS